MTLPASFLERPIAHRALHDAAKGRVENSLASIEAAAQAGYGIEIDVQCASDGVPMVFHDYDLKRLTIEMGPLAQRSSAQLRQIPLMGDEGTIPTLDEVLACVAGRVPLLIAIKDQDGALGPKIGPLGRAVADLLADYSGDVAVMSFNPTHVAEMGRIAPDLPRGLTTCAFRPDDWPTIPQPTLERLAKVPDFAHLGASFVSHDWRDLDMPRIADLKSEGAAILCWTVRGPEDEATARRIADNITFEGYPA